MEQRSKLPHDDDDKISKHHLREVKSAFRKHLCYFDDMDITTTRKPVINTWLGGLSVGREMKRHALGYLRGIFSYALDQEDIPFIPDFPSIKRVRVKKKGLKLPQQEEILLCIPRKHRPIFEWLKATGRRINEARALKNKDIEMGRNVYRVSGAFDLEEYKPYPKVRANTGSEFPIAVLDNDGQCQSDLRPIIAESLKGRIPHPEAWVFEYTDQYGRKSHYPYKALSRIFNKARDEAGYPTVTLNVFGRHSMGYQLRNGGATYSDVGDILGNTAQVAEAHYAHVDAGSKAKILSMRNLKSGHEVAMNGK